MAGSLLEDIFFVKDIDPGGKKFDRGSLMPLYLGIEYNVSIFLTSFYKQFD